MLQAPSLAGGCLCQGNSHLCGGRQLHKEHVAAVGRCGMMLGLRQCTVFASFG